MDFKIKQKLCAQYRRELKERITAQEYKVMSLLEKHNIRFMFQKGFIAGDNFVIADFYLPRPLKLVIEIDGYYHETEKQKKRDKNKDWYYSQRRFKVLRIKNEQIDSLSDDELLKIIME